MYVHVWLYLWVWWKNCLDWRMDNITEVMCGQDISRYSRIKIDGGCIFCALDFYFTAFLMVDPVYQSFQEIFQKSCTTILLSKYIYIYIKRTRYDIVVYTYYKWNDMLHSFIRSSILLIQWVLDYCDLSYHDPQNIDII